MIIIGIDTGVHTGFAVWDSKTKCLLRVETLTITQAMNRVRELCNANGIDNVVLFIEDARQRNWFGNAGREKLQGAGSVKRDCSIWETFCQEQGIKYRMVAPKNNRTKLSAVQFKIITGWQGRTTEHSRDAAIMVFGR